MTEKLLKVALNTITITIVYLYVFFTYFYEKVCRGRCVLYRISQSFTCFYIHKNSTNVTILAILSKTFGLSAPIDLFDGFPTFWPWAYLMKVILIVPDEGYSERTRCRLFWSYLMKVILSVPDEGYSERTWWRLFWSYLMKVILNVPETRHAHLIRYTCIRVYDNSLSDTDFKI